VNNLGRDRREKGSIDEIGGLDSIFNLVRDNTRDNLPFVNRRKLEKRV
jgi:hypothetical protein